MKFNVTDTIAFPPERVYRAYRDHLPELVPELPNVDGIDVQERVEIPGGLRLLNVWRISGMMPAVIRPFLSERMMSYIDRADWLDDASQATWDIEVPSLPGAVDCQGTTSFRPGSSAETTEITMDGDVTLALSRILGVFGWTYGLRPTLEQFLVDRIRTNFLGVTRALEHFIGQRAVSDAPAPETAPSERAREAHSTKHETTSELPTVNYRPSSSFTSIHKQEPQPEMAIRPDTTRSMAGSEQVVIANGENPHLLLEETLVRAGFWDELARRGAEAGVAPAELKIAIKPDLEIFESEGPTGTDPALVEHLVDLLAVRGYSNVRVGAALTPIDLRMENREILSLARAVGYRELTPGGHRYTLVDFGEDRVPVTFDAGSAAEGLGVSRSWVEAQVRVNFAKNKTHARYALGLCLYNLLSVLPADERTHLFYLCAPEISQQLLRHVPPHFNLIDAITSNTGVAGSLVARPMKTDTLIAGRHLVLVDWAAALKMNADPYASPLNRRALKTSGLPEKHEVVGDLRPYPGWVNAHPLLVDSFEKMKDEPALLRVVESMLLSVDPILFPLRSLGERRLNAVWGPLARQASGPLADNGLVYSVAGVAALRSSAEAWKILFGKEALRQKVGPLPIDPHAIPLADYESIVAYLEPLEQLIRETPPDANGLRWRYLDGTVLFHFSRVIAAPFEDFVRRVDITKAVQYMRDYIGGSFAPVARDEAGRVTHQAERSMYLPQPNYIALYDGRFLDVTKLDYIRYAPGKHKIFWRAVGTENDSVDFDDGTVTFDDLGDEGVRVTVVARQKFPLPSALQAVQLDLHATVKDALVAREYFQFFRETMNNYEAQYEGRAFRVGRPWEDEARGGTGSQDLRWPAGLGADPLETLRPFVAAGRRGLSSLLGGLRPLHKPHADAGSGAGDADPTRPPSPRLGAGAALKTLGTVAAALAPAVETLWQDLADALAKDLGALRSDR